MLFGQLLLCIVFFDFKMPLNVLLLTNAIWVHPGQTRIVVRILRM